MKKYTLDGKRYTYASLPEENWIEVGNVSHAGNSDKAITLWNDNRENVTFYKFTIDSEQPIRTVYKEIVIMQDSSGFGMYDALEGEAWEDKDDLLSEIRNNVEELYILGEDELPDDVEDIRGKIYNEPYIVFATINENYIQYGGIGEFEE